MDLSEFGYNDTIDSYRIAEGVELTDTGRVIRENRERYTVLTSGGEVEAEITGNMRFAAQGREDFPAVGDWVALKQYEGGFAIIHKIFPRSTLLSRKAVGKAGEMQVIAANIDVALLVQATGRDFSISRLERYLTLCNTSGIKPVILLSKTDLLSETELQSLTASVRSRVAGIPFVAVSNVTAGGYDAVRQLIERGKTYCLLGSSGAGKSTLLNNLAGQSLMKTKEISSFTGRGKHMTTHRELFVIENGGILIDNPGIREVGITDTDDALENTFDSVLTWAKDCRYSDCTHTNEDGCRVLEALERGDIDRSAFENYLRMLKERSYFETSLADRHRKDRIFGKILKDYKKRSGENDSF